MAGNDNTAEMIHEDALPGHESEVDEFHCDRELRRDGDRWAVAAL